MYPIVNYLEVSMNSSFGIASVGGLMQSAIGQIEGDLQQKIMNVQNNPNASTSDMMGLQATLAIWQAKVTAASNIIKDVASGAKTIANNVGP